MYEMNQQPLNHESTPITTKPGAFSIKLYGRVYYESKIYGQNLALNLHIKWENIWIYSQYARKLFQKFNGIVPLGSP